MPLWPRCNADGTGLVYAGYIGGSGDDEGDGIAVDGAGNAYVTGWTNSTEATFPVVGGPDLTYNGGERCLRGQGASGWHGLVYAGYIGGNGDDAGYRHRRGRRGQRLRHRRHRPEATFPVAGGPDLTSKAATMPLWPK